MTKNKNTLKDNKVVKGFASAIVVVFILAIFIWTLDPNMRDQVMTYIRGGKNFITVNGDNLLTAGQIIRVIENRNIDFRRFPDSLIIQAMKNFRDINREINRKVLINYAEDTGLELSPKAKQMLAIELYRQAKMQFEKKHNIRFRMRLPDFYEIARENYLIGLVNTSMTQGILITKPEVALKYMIENNKRQVIYASYSFEDFFKNQKISSQELKKFFTSNQASSFRSNVRNKVTATAITGTDKKKMAKLLSDIQSKPGYFEKIAKEQKAKQKDYIINNATKELNPLKQIAVGKYSRLIERRVRGRIVYHIFKVIKKHERKFEDLNTAERQKLAQSYKKSNQARKKYMSSFQTKVKSLFKSIKSAVDKGADFSAQARKNGLKLETTEFFPVALKDSIDKTIHDPVQNLNKKPIKSLSSSNQDFFKTVFSLKKGQVSEMQNNGFTYYMVKLIGEKKAGKMDAASYKKYLVAMKKRHREEYLSKLMQNLYKKYEVKWNEKNIIKLVRALQGRS